MTVEGSAFIDANILIYAYDINAEEKHGIARATVERLKRDRGGTLSTQVPQEFFVTTTRKLSTPLHPIEKPFEVEV